MTKSKKALYGLIGFPVKHSLSSAMHNAAFAACDVAAEYQLFEIKPEELEDFLLKRDDLSGFNITIPHKVKACKILQKKFPVNKNSEIQENSYYVKLSGAVNTVRRDDLGLEYFNTDAAGFLKSVAEDLDFKISGKTLLLIGCGGAGRAIISALSWKSQAAKKLYLYDSSQAVIKALKEHFLTLPKDWLGLIEQKVEFISQEEMADKIKESQLLVNATPLGMKAGDPLPVDKNMLHKDLFVYDVVYNRVTELISEAKKACRGACGGLGMLLHQGVAAWELWMGEEAPVEVMRQALNEEIKKKC